VIPLVLQHHPDRSLPHVRGEPDWSCHDSILSRSGASAKRGVGEVVRPPGRWQGGSAARRARGPSAAACQRSWSLRDSTRRVRARTRRTGPSSCGPSSARRRGATAPSCYQTTRSRRPHRARTA
jgi:hypothetical protein